MNHIVNVTMDSVCTLFSIIILLYLRFSPDRRDRLNRLLGWLCICNIGMLIGDIPYWLCEGFARPYFPAALWIGIFVQFVCGCVIPWVYSLYLFTYLSRKRKMEKWIMQVIHGMFAVDAVLLAINYWNRMYYYIDESNRYQRGEQHWLSQAIPIVILLFDAGIVLCHSRLLKIREITAFLSYQMLAVAGILIQAMGFGLSTTYLACTLSVFIIFLCIQSEQRFMLEQQKRKLDQAHLRIMLSQIQPHFLYNALQGIKQLCDSDPGVASEALEHFSYYLRGNLDSLSNEGLVPFEKELEHIKDFLYLEKMRFGEKLNINYEIRERDFLIPPLTVQPLIENAIRHGINRKKEGGTLTVRSERIAQAVIVMIEDDGVGFDPLTPKSDGRTHIGIENTRRRLKTLCGGSLEIKSQVGSGTTATVILPFK